MKGLRNLIITVIAVLVGLAGSLVCILPSASAEYKLVNNYINAVNGANLEKMNSYLASDVLSSALGEEFEGVLDSSNKAQGNVDKLSALKSSILSIRSELPEDAKEIKSIKLIGCNIGEETKADFIATSSTNVDAIVQLTYINADDETVSVTSVEDIQLCKIQNQLKIASF